MREKERERVTERERDREREREGETEREGEKLQTQKNSWNFILLCFTPQNGVKHDRCRASIRLPFMIYYRWFVTHTYCTLQNM